MPSKEIIHKSFEGRTTPLQRTLIETWLQHPANVEQYYEWLEEWERANPQFLPDVTKAYDQSLRQSPAGTSATVQPMPRSNWSRWMLAASVGLALLTGSGWQLRHSLFFEIYQTAYGEVRTLTLPDGSRVTLNANTQLRLPRWGFGTGTREVWLAGEAEFSVRHLPAHQPFLIHTPDSLTVRVLGTKFVVYSRLKGSKVALINGSVQLQSNRHQRTKSITIKPGDVATYTEQGVFALRHRQPMPAHTAWKEHRFVFENTPLTDIASQITEQFGVTVDITEPSLAQRRLGGTFTAQTAHELLMVVSQLLDVQVKKTAAHRYRLSTAP